MVLYSSNVLFPILQQTLKQIRKCHSVFGINQMIRQEMPEQYALTPVSTQHHEVAIEVLKQHFLSQHVLVQDRKMDLSEDRALDEYLVGLMKQGNSMIAHSEDGRVAGLCVNFACSAVDPNILRQYAYYRQNPNTKDFLYFTAKLQETPNLWEVFKQTKIFEIKMLTVVPEFRRQGLAVMMAQKSRELARDEGFNVVRMDCINPYDYKIAERLMMRCAVSFPLHRLRGQRAPFVRRRSEHNRRLRVYVHAQPPHHDRLRDQDLEAMIE